MDRRRFARDTSCMHAASGARRRRPATLAAACTAVVIAVLAAGCGGGGQRTTSAPTTTVATGESFTALSAGDHPDAITAGPDGNLWFTVPRVVGPGAGEGNKIGRMTPTGAITEFSAGIGGEIGRAG